MRARHHNLITLGEAIRRRREVLGLSQEQLALKCDLDRTYVGGVERGERNIGFINLCRIAEALDRSLSDLLADLL